MTSISPAPKPTPKPPRPAKAIAKRSAKKAADPTANPFSTIPKSGKPRPKAKKRKPSEYARIYGSRARVAWVKMQSCIVRGGVCHGPTENAHVISDEQRGMGRKSGYRCIAPVCHGHHRILHHVGASHFEIHFLGALGHLVVHASRTQDLWLLHCGRHGLDPETGNPLSRGAYQEGT